MQYSRYAMRLATRSTLSTPPRISIHTPKQAAKQHKIISRKYNLLSVQFRLGRSKLKESKLLQR
uniref:Uncharacterized protein n=1 Tax=Arundo donax TaxID=35708 RepID=A0A0A9GTZ3_ARUDO